MTDQTLRAMTDDGAFRVIAARTTQTVRKVWNAQRPHPDNLRHVADMTTAAVLYRETMAPNLRVQCGLKGSGNTGTILSDSHPDGWVRALVQSSAEARRVDVSAGSMMQMMRCLPNGELHRGVVAIPEPATVSEGLMACMQQSEQVVSVARVGVAHQGTEVTAAGGFLVQLLPEAKEAESALWVLTQRLEDFPKISELLEEHDASPATLVNEIFFGMKYTVLDSSAVRFGCECSRIRVMASLGTLGKDDIESLVAAGEPLDMSCDYCGKQYLIEIEELRGLLSSS